jgi:PKD repeat protein
MLVICFAGLVIATLLTAIAVAQPASPTTSIFLNGTQGNSGWFTSDVTIILNATDYSGLGINRTEYNFNGSASSWMPYTGPFKITKEDMTAVYYRSVDNASVAEPLRRLVVSIDRTPPSLTYTLTPAPNANGWTSHNVQLHYEVSDAVSGLAIRPQDLTMTNEGDYSTLTGTATDVAGNTASVTIPAFGIDRTPPVVGNLTLQGNGYVGDYLPVSASVVEANPQRMEWDFGDGTGTKATANDNVARASHAYKQPGSYRITLNVADKAGNAVKSTASVTIYGTVPTAQVTVTPVATPEVTPTPTLIPLPSPSPKPAPAPGLALISLALIGGTMLAAATRKK